MGYISEQVITQDKWGSNLLGASGRMCRTEFCRIVRPERQGYWAMNPPTPDHHWLKTAPGDISNFPVLQF